MDFKKIYDFIMLTGVGGFITVAGGITGLILGINANQAAGCGLNCPSPWRLGVYGAIPGILIVLIQWAAAKFSKPK